MTTIVVGASHEPLQAFADLFDGRSARAQRVGVTIDETPTGGVLLLALPDGGTLRWPLEALRSPPDQADRTGLILARTGDPAARLMVDDKVLILILRARAPFLRRRPPVKGKGRLLAWACAAVASVALIVFVLVPVMADQLAEYLPPEGEKALGDATLKQIRSALSENEFAPMALCETRDGLAALDKMTTRLAGDLELPYPINLHVLDSDIINAFALPGGHVVLFRGLIDAAEQPEEVAAVYAHELGHVINRDPTRSALRSAGSIGVIGLLLGDFAGGTVVLFLTERLIDASYSQAAEAGADAFAHELLIRKRVRPDALASMLQRLKKKYGDNEGITAHFAAHPKLGDRIEAARLAAERLAEPPVPILTEAEWQAMQRICR
ncbi:M48 family metallopeptidase [Frigidibacter sp. ROC022]|uniref:M48 family metallopeptidase n=1 Tax=Frigidibacter sp. ROC022 TaxID=2971796 RepID=UPI00215B20EE|nr:M48 family metallopeptidase [Frigidibacter sp. ROC022]MCR8726517.1 M48 family metallopeptidase [Frigidibacter sp. ROC022]